MATWFDSMLSRLKGSTEPTELSITTLSQVFDAVMPPRQREASKLWLWYCGKQYEGRMFAWDGSKILSDAAMDRANATGIQPSDYWPDPPPPLKMRKPTAPYRLPKLVVDRFTGILFAEGQHPQFSSPAAPDTQDLANALAEHLRLWSTMAEARTRGGACGAVGLSFRVVDGHLRIEQHPPDQTTPEWLDREAGLLKSLQIQFMYSEDAPLPQGKWGKQWFVYRRVIDAESDVLYEPLAIKTGVTDYINHQWVEQTRVQHPYGFCPALWLQNEADKNNIDGPSDICGILGAVEAIDAQRSQALRGTLANMDPTFLVKSDNSVKNGITKGSGSAIVMGTQDSAGYMEIEGSGIAAANTQISLLRLQALEEAQCVLEDVGPAVAKTATEINRSMTSMLVKGGRLREQYGQRGVLPLMQMIIRAIVIHHNAGEAINLPQRQKPAEEAGGDATTEKAKSAHYVMVDQTLPDSPDAGGLLSLHWGPFYPPTVDDALKSVQAAALAVSAHLISSRSGTDFIATHFGITDAAASRAAALVEQEEAEQKAVEFAMLSSSRAAPPPNPEPL